MEAPVSRLLILGSMPGRESLARRRYYAHPRNAFWPIMKQILELPETTPYDTCLAALRKFKVSLWDVLALCRRPGSLDNHILAQDATPNRLDDFRRRHPELAAVAFNGRKARSLFTRYWANDVESLWENLILIDLPSTSPAHAALRPSAKYKLWEQRLQPLLSFATRPKDRERALRPDYPKTNEPRAHK
ncbi:MAG: DNA-deoxyinosine glycosylase [Deltaproteobacteria bacterium]|nr:DNA-deoxyinosine glycosylase [Deltaproteobacteria bacterium]